MCLSSGDIMPLAMGGPLDPHALEDAYQDTPSEDDGDDTPSQEAHHVDYRPLNITLVDVDPPESGTA